MLSTATTARTTERSVFNAATSFPKQSVPQKHQLVAQWVVEDGQLVCKWMTR
ncbi:MAG: hypothetical protein AAF821_25010 [Cyanobacteria bacterium P01_D01_bin.156]